jgi:acyl-CoA thioester hydrolase
MLDVRLPDFPFAISLYVWFRDLDAMGHVNNAVYFTYFEQARTRYWLSLISDEVPASALHQPPNQENDYRKLGFIVVHAECDFASAAEMGESLLVGCRVSDIRKSSFDFEYRIVTGQKTGSDAEARLVANGKTIQALYDWDAKKTIPFTDALRKKIEAREGKTPTRERVVAR